MSQPPALAVVVIGYRAPETLLDAVRSLLAQDVPLEIVVVNSGGGGISRQLSEARLDVATFEFEERLLVGAARNRGIEATQAPFVAFLADDCLACPGWARRRLEWHLAGHATVASAVVNSDPGSHAAWAAHLTMYMRRLPELPEKEALRYGVSFDRRLFAAHGMFDERRSSGEDTEFLARLGPELVPVWDSRIRTVHRNTATLKALVADQARRGFRYGAHLAARSGHGPWRAFRAVFHDRRHIARFVELGLAGDDRERARKAVPLAKLSLFVNASGAALGAIRSGRARTR